MSKAKPPLALPKGLLLRGWLSLGGPLLGLMAPRILKKRLARGKEDPARVAEKLGQPSAARPEGRLVWLHAVGLGEVLALRGLIDAMAARDPELRFLVTSSARSSAQVMGRNLPPRTQHQYLPLDAPAFMQAFLEHWRPDLSIWAEQEIWPSAVVEAANRGVPLALVNARITAQSYAKRRKAKGLYRDLFARFQLIAAQDPASASHLTALGAAGVTVRGSLKSAAPPLAFDHAALSQMQRAVAGRRVWVAASTHPGDEAEAISAQQKLGAEWLLILVPRDIGRKDAVSAALEQAGLSYLCRSDGGMPASDTRVWLADSYGELGLWYRLAETALIGGGFDAIGGHNPWEAAALSTAVLHGPDIANFKADYAALHQGQAALEVGAGRLLAVLGQDLSPLAANALAMTAQAKGGLDPLAAELMGLMR